MSEIKFFRVLVSSIDLDHHQACPPLEFIGSSSSPSSPVGSNPLHTPRSQALSSLRSSVWRKSLHLKLYHIILKSVLLTMLIAYVYLKLILKLLTETMRMSSNKLGSLEKEELMLLRNRINDMIKRW